MTSHRNDSKQDKCVNKPLYQEVNKTGWDDWYIELYQDYPCENKEQLNRREGQIIREIGTLNKQIAGRSIEQWRQDNCDKIKQEKKEYRQANAEKLKEKNKQYYRENADKLKENMKEYKRVNADKIKEYQEQYYRDNLEKRKEYDRQYRRANAEKYKQEKKEYRRINSDKIKEYRRANSEKLNQYIAEQITCECGAVIARGGNARHKRTKKHMDIMEKN
jgi:hypothetical protein